MKYPGLSLSEVKKLQSKYGPNSLPAEKSTSPIKIFISQFTNPLVYLLVAAGLISLFLREYLDVGFIFSVVFVNSIFGFFQEYRTQKTLVTLKKLLKPIARVVRDGKRQEIDATQLVPGDIVLLAHGDKIPADGEALETISFLVNEAILTGESEAVDKKPNETVFMGTVVFGGKGVMRVKKTGLSTKIGEIAQSLKQTIQPQTPLQFRLKKLTKIIIYLSLFLSCLTFFFGLMIGRGFWQMLQMASILLVTITPAALLMSVTLILAIGMQRILKRKALIRKLLAVETLGSVTTICTDKTGTLTLGKMSLVEADFAEREKGLLAMCLCNDLSDTAEIALWDYLQKQKNFYPQETFDKYARIFEIPFGSDHKFMASVNCLETEKKKECSLMVKGAAEIVLAMSNLSKADKVLVTEKINNWAKRGLKVLGVAFRKVTGDEIKKINVSNMPTLEWAGLVGLWDPPREEVKEALSIVKRAGVKVKVVTGDYRQTAEKIMDFLGIKIKPEEVLEGENLENIDDESLKAKVLNISLFTRVTPLQKLRIVKALQELGEIVAMTGDGVNDAPALKKSNIGIVVDEAQEVAKETSDLILLDSNFRTIVSAIEEGRTVFENIKKVVFFMLSNSFAEIVLILSSIILDWPTPLTITQILWIHLLCDGPEDVVLGFEPKENEIMIEGPKKIDEPILNKTGIFLIFLVSFLSGFFALSLFWYFGLYGQNPELGRTMAFTTLSFNSILYIFSCRTFRKPFWRYENFWANKWLFTAVIFSFILQIIIIYLPFTQNLLRVVPLNLEDWGLLLAIAFLIVLLIELTKAKMVKRNRNIFVER